MDVVRRFLLEAVDAYGSRKGTGPTVQELAADLGLPAEFGYKHLVDHLESEVALERLAYRRGRFTVTDAGRLALDADEAPHRARLAEDTRAAGSVASPRA